MEVLTRARRDGARQDILCVKEMWKYDILA